MKDYFKYVICWFLGHISEPYLTETEGWINTRRCSRCHATLGLPKFKFKQIPPPNSTPDQIKSWEEYCENHWQEIRNSVEVAKKINQSLKQK